MDLTGAASAPDAKRRRVAGETAADGLLASPSAHGHVKEEALSGIPAGEDEAAPEAAAAQAVEVYQVPAYAGWFRWDRVHPLERRSLPEFFPTSADLLPPGPLAPHSPAAAAAAAAASAAASKSAELYMEYRNSMINLYRAQTQRTLTFTQVRRCLVGDVVALRRIFLFLAHWGLINSHLPTALLLHAPPLEPSPPGTLHPLTIPVTRGSRLAECAGLLAPGPSLPLPLQGLPALPGADAGGGA